MKTWEMSRIAFICATYDVLLMLLSQDMVGVNLAGLQFCQRELENSGVHVFDDVSVKVRKAKRKKLTVVQ